MGRIHKFWIHQEPDPKFWLDLVPVGPGTGTESSWSNSIEKFPNGYKNYLIN